jgi:putative SOS response-associated peptidase YedK
MQSGQSLFAFAGIWDRWTSARRTLVESCAILTTAPNELLKNVHDRMPVILRPEKYQEWLATPVSGSRRLMNLLVPFEAGMMKRFPVSSLLNDPQNDVLECTLEVSEFVLAQPTLS